MRVNDVQRITLLIALVWAGLFGVGLGGCTRSSEPSSEQVDTSQVGENGAAANGAARKGEGDIAGKPAKLAAAPPPAAEAALSDGLRGGGTELGNRPGQGYGKDLGARGSSERFDAPTPVPTIDPNGRFATTYRPGGGHLAAFDAAVSRGIVPQGERELVGDVGARYAAKLDPPKDKALAIRAELERGKLPPAGGEVHLRVSLQASEKAPPRPQLSVHLVLDVSGSMRGEPMARARDAALALVDKLDEKDDFSLITFSSDAKVVVPGGLIGARRAAVKNTIRTIEEGGGTNIGEGLRLGYEQAQRRGAPEDAVRVVLLLSDGRANAGITNRSELSKLALDAFQGGIQTSSFGLGSDYDGELMSDIASDGAGGYYYLRDPEQIAPALASELEKRLDPVATAVEIRIRLQPDVDLLRVYGSRLLTQMEASRVRAIEVAADKQAEQRDGIKADRKDDAEGGMRFFIPAFARDDAHAVLVKLRVPAGSGTRKLASVELKYKDRLNKKNVVDEGPLSVPFGQSDADSGASVDPSVARTVQGFLSGETLADAAQRIARGDRAGAVAALSERESLLRVAAEKLGEPLFLRDAERLARLRSFAGTSTGLGDPLVLSMLLETASRSHMH